MAADAVLAGTETGAGHRGRGGFAHRAAGPLQTAGWHCICTHQRGGKLAGVVRQVHIYGCCRDDACWVWDPHIYKNNMYRPLKYCGATWTVEKTEGGSC